MLLLFHFMKASVWVLWVVVAFPCGWNYFLILSFVLFAEENQLSFTCHFKCGAMMPNDPPVYEMVECTGYFRKWNNSNCKLLLPSRIHPWYFCCSEFLSSSFCFQFSYRQKMMRKNHLLKQKRSVISAQWNCARYKSSGSLREWMKENMSSRLDTAWSGSSSSLTTGVKTLKIPLDSAVYSPWILIFLENFPLLQRASHCRLPAFWGPRDVRLWLLPPAGSGESGQMPWTLWVTLKHRRCSLAEFCLTWCFLITRMNTGWAVNKIELNAKCALVW